MLSLAQLDLRKSFHRLGAFVLHFLVIGFVLWEFRCLSYPAAGDRAPATFFGICRVPPRQLGSPAYSCGRWSLNVRLLWCWCPLLRDPCAWPPFAPFCHFCLYLPGFGYPCLVPSFFCRLRCEPIPEPPRWHPDDPLCPGLIGIGLVSRSWLAVRQVGRSLFCL